MSKITLTEAKLIQVRVKPNKDGDVYVQVQLDIPFTNELLRLMPQAGQLFTVSLANTQLSLEDAELVGAGRESSRR